MNRRILVSCVGTILMLLAGTATCETLISGEITDLQWTLDGNPYILTDDSFVQYNSTLIVEPGVSVYGMPECRLQVYGTLITQGQKGEQILFTALDQNQPWGGIMMMSGAGATVDMTYTTVEYAYSYGREHGGAFNCKHGALFRLQNCFIQHNEAYNDGGGVYLYYTTFDISYTYFTSNLANRIGGGLDFAGGNDGTVHHVIFENNHAGVSGGAVYFYSNASNIIDHATLYNNTTDGTGLDAYYYGSNPSGFNNSIIWHEPYDGSPIFNPVQPFVITYSCVSDPSLTGWEGVFVDDPLFENPGNSNYRLTAESPCIDAGDPDTELDPDDSLPDVGRYFYGESVVDPQEIVLELTPIDFMVPARGGYVTYSASAFNNTNQDYSNLLYYIMVTAPNGQEYGPFTSFTFDLGLGEVRSVDMLGLQVPQYAYGGGYTLTGQIERLSVVLAEDEFSFFKRHAPTANGLTPEQWGLDRFASAEFATPDNTGTVLETYMVLQATPNPFNASTVLHMELPRSDHVAVTVFDIRGRLVAELMDGTMAAGRHSLSFNAQNLSSGVYFIRTSTSHLGSSIQKVMLIK